MQLMSATQDGVTQATSVQRFKKPPCPAVPRKGHEAGALMRMVLRVRFGQRIASRLVKVEREEIWGYIYTSDIPFMMNAAAPEGTPPRRVNDWKIF